MSLIVRIVKLQTVDSTNQWALNSVLNKHPFCVSTETQTAGKGRLGRNWASCEGNLMMSFVDQCELDYSVLLGLSPFVGLSIVEFLKQYYGLDAKVKWPNDIYFADHKVGGILIETKPNNGLLKVVIGLGLHFKGCDDFKGLGVVDSLQFFLNRWLSHWLDVCYSFKNNPMVPVQRWNSVDFYSNQEVQVIQDDKHYNAFAIGIDSQGQYHLKDVHDHPVIINDLGTSIRPL